MKSFTRLSIAAAAALATTAVIASSASAASAPTADHQGARLGYAQQAVFVQTDNLSGNAVVAYQRAADGKLSQAGVYWTGGLGGMLTGSVADHLASQGSLTYDAQHSLLYAVNAGSNTVSVFSVSGDRLTLRQVVGSGGAYPVSVAVHGDLVYVLNGLNGGSVQGFVVLGGRLVSVPSWNRALGLDPTATPQFVNTPGQVGFTAGGSQLVVTTKANGSDIDVFHLNWLGAPSATPVVNSEPGAVPFSFVPDGPNGLFLTEAGPNAVATFTVNADGTVTQTAISATGGAATCWITADGNLLFASNAGSSTINGFQVGWHSALSAVGTTSTDPGSVDSAVSADGRYLYAQTGVNGIVDEFAVGAGGSLAEIGSLTVPGGAGGEGIVAF
jgi:6-phosphogluconolactonase (cycloisomerase 2 family)